MAIYTKTGDKGTTSLANGERVSKTDARLEAYGTVDELNSWIGLVRSGIQNIDSYADRVQTELAWVQNKLFNLGASLSCAEGEWVTEDEVKQLEHWIDAMQAEVPPMRAFVLPAGGETVARCHVARTVCRRAERRIEGLRVTGYGLRVTGDGLRVTGDGLRDTELKFVNRLSDYLFVLARFIGHKSGENEEKWQK